MIGVWPELPKNVGDLGKLIVAKAFKKLPKVQKIAKSGHTGWEAKDRYYDLVLLKVRAILEILAKKQN